MLLTLSLTGCSSTSSQPPDDQPADFCPDQILEFGNLEVVYEQNNLTFSFDVPPICCHRVVVLLFHAGEYLDRWESPYEFSRGHREMVTFTSEGSYPSGNYEVRIGTGIYAQFSEVFVIP